MLESYLGTPYQREDEDGNYLGCLLPMYIVYPEMNRAPLPKNNAMGFMMDELLKKFKWVEKQELQKYDIIVGKMPKGIIHIAVYNGNNKVVQTSRGMALRMDELNMEDKRVIGVLRWV